MTATTQEKTIATRLTPAGRSAIAVVLVRGPAAEQMLDACFASANGLSMSMQPRDGIRFGHWRSTGEELVVCRRSTSVGDPGEIEVHCHGGSAAVQTILADLKKAGCEIADWGLADWGQLVEPNQIAAEATLALAEALTERTASVLLDQQGGALEREIRAAVSDLEESDTKSATQRIESLLTQAVFGQRLTRAWRLVLVGPPNVGKSRLMNALVGFERAIVYDQPGTTRDVVAAMTAVDGWPVELLDTAGLRETDDELEATGVQQTLATIDSADLTLIAAEAGDSVARDWRDIEASLPRGLARLRVATKADLCSEGFIPPSGAVLTSAETGTGIGDLLAAISQLLVPCPPAPGEGVPFTGRQVARLTEARDALRGGRLAETLAELYALLC